MKLTDAAAIKVGAANASAVYLGSTKLWPVAAASSGNITFVGGNTAYAPAGSIALPSGCAAGDFVVIGINSNTSSAASIPSGSINSLAKVVYYSGSGKYTGQWGYFLSSGDVSAGTIPLSTDRSAAIAVFRGVNAADPFDVIGTLATDAAPVRNPLPITATSITTTGTSRMLVFMGVVNSTGGALGTVNPPAGFTDAATYTGNSSYITTLAYAVQSAAGATGDATAGFTNNNFGRTGALLVALKPA